jgi:hypothetical protein
MQTLDDVARIAGELPEVTEGIKKQGGGRTWDVRGKGFAWERPFSKSALREALAEGWRACAPRELADRYHARLSRTDPQLRPAPPTHVSRCP